MSLTPIVVIGAGGHARVVAEIILLTKEYQIIGCVDPKPHNALAEESVPYLGDDYVLSELFKRKVKYAAMGMAGFDNLKRKSLYEKVKSIGFELPVLKHPAAVVSESVHLGEGTVIMAGAILNPRVRVKENVVINTGSIIEHDCFLGHSVQIGPGAILCGNVTVEESSFIGAGTCIIQGVTVDKGAFVGAGVVVIRNVSKGAKVFGNTASLIKERYIP